MSKALISIVSPVYGCRDCLRELALSVEKVFANTDLDWELILVDDRGPDAPWPVIKELAEKNSKIKGVRLSKNHGQHLAIWAGLETAKGDWVSVVDCDLQDDPNVILELYTKALEDSVDSVVVSRGEWKDTWFRRFASRMFYRTMKLLAGVSLDSDSGNFGLYSRRLIDLLLTFKEKEVYFPFMVMLTGLPRSIYTVDRSERAEGDTSYNIVRLMRLAISIIIRFSDRPLKLSVAIGLMFSGLSALISLIIFVAWALGTFTVPGWSSLVLSVWFLSGLIMAVLGIHGFYMGRIFTEVQNRPRIIVEETTDKQS